MKTALILEDEKGNTFAYVANSQEAANKVREVTRFEVLGSMPVLTLTQAIGLR